MKLTKFALFGMIALVGCVGEEGGKEDQTGQIELSLIGSASSGNTYRLRDGIVMVQGPANTIFFNTEDDPNRFRLSAAVPPGGYFTFLQEGWRLERLNLDTSIEPVEAQLLSPNPLYFDVFANQNTTVALRFRVGADDVVLDQGSFDIVLEVEEEQEPTASVLCTDDSECASGQTCCLAGFVGTCTSLESGEACPLPDLTVSADAAQFSLSIGRQSFPADSCAIVEGCVGGAGERRLMSFSTETPNVGEADMILGDPTLVDGFEFSSCHGHYHFEGYARYELLDTTGVVVATGHKQAFCLMDTSSVGIPGSPTTPRYHCGFQGIQRGWSDVYSAGLDCQWVDITGVGAGDYFLRITINADRTLPESDYGNNTIEVPVTIPEEIPTVPGDPLSPCSSPAGGEWRDCGWSIAPGYEGVACTPGAPITVGCGCPAGSCGSDPMLRVCDGASGCTGVAALASVDDTCGYCPQASFVCPESGVYTVLVAAYNSSSAFTCDVTASAPAP
ncbi:lysyl oxidase family protein [Sorangium sp. So ce1078]|uniref:lysyl oxidase family protein n=1 Tax=Sorangium sp. So ce1078 TaxID=3133329 RepID=UPI003F6442A7